MSLGGRHSTATALARAAFARSPGLFPPGWALPLFTSSLPDGFEDPLHTPGSHYKEEASRLIRLTRRPSLAPFAFLFPSPTKFLSAALNGSPDGIQGGRSNCKSTAPAARRRQLLSLASQPHFAAPEQNDAGQRLSFGLVHTQPVVRRLAGHHLEDGPSLRSRLGRHSSSPSSVQRIFR